jgi:hypothetical protein
MNARLNLSGSPLAAKSMKYMASASKVVIEGSTLPKSTENMGTRMADAAGGVTDEAWANAARHYDEEQLASPASPDSQEGRRMMNTTPRREHHDDLPSIRAAYIALGWVVVFIGFHLYWYRGGSFASPGKLPPAPHSLIGWTFEVLVMGAFVLGFLVPLAISRGWADGRLARPVAILVWLGGVILDLRGVSGIVDDLTRAAGVRTGITGLSTMQTTGIAHMMWSGWAIDSYFLIGGLIFTWLAIRQRHHRQSRSSLPASMPWEPPRRISRSGPT